MVTYDRQSVTGNLFEAYLSRSITKTEVTLPENLKCAKAT